MQCRLCNFTVATSDLKPTRIEGYILSKELGKPTKNFDSGHFGANQLLKPLGFYIYRCSSPESGERDVDLPHEFFGVCTVSPGMSCLKFQIPVKPCLSRIVAPQKNRCGRTTKTG